MHPIDPATIATISALASAVTAALGALAAAFTAPRPISDDPWTLTWARLDDDTRAWVAEQYAAVDLPAPSLNRAIGRDAHMVDSLIGHDYR